MKFDGFFYQVQAQVTLTGKDLADLYEVASSHYDHKCRAMATPPAAGETNVRVSETAWWIYREMELFCSRYNILPPAPPAPGDYLERCRNNPKLTTDVTMSWGVLDTLCKILEMDTFCLPAGVLTPAYRTTPHPDLVWEMRRVFKRVQAESRRLNETAVAEDDGA